MGSFSKPYYHNSDLFHSIIYQGTDLNSVLNIVSQTHFVAIAPKWLVEYYSNQLNLRSVELPWEKTARPCYLIWHESTTRDKGHKWMKTQLGQLSN